jgi:hypothetical protein
MLKAAAQRDREQVAGVAVRPRLDVQDKRLELEVYQRLRWTLGFAVDNETLDILLASLITFSSGVQVVVA